VTASGGVGEATRLEILAALRQIRGRLDRLERQFAGTAPAAPPERPALRLVRGSGS
jgi:hypothetical protein